MRKRALAICAFSGILSEQTSGEFMTSSRILIVLTCANFLLLTALLIERTKPAFAKQSVLPVLRGSALEIVDTQGRVRATLGVLPPSVVDSKHYPETVLLRLIDPKTGPVVKIGASTDGAGLGLTNGSSRGVQLLAHDSASILRMTDNAGRERVLRP
jgi:hypothetical protein